MGDRRCVILYDSSLFKAPQWDEIVFAKEYQLHLY